MRFRWNKTWVALPLCLAAGAVLAGAAPQVTSPLKQNQAMLTEATQAFRAMKMHAKDVEALYSAAEKEKNVIKLNCIVQRLDEIKGGMKVASTTSEAIQRIAPGLPPTATDAGLKFEYERMMILLQKVQSSAAQAKACVGAEMNFTGQQSTTVTVDPSVPEGDPTSSPPSTAPTTPPRPSASSTD